MGICYFRNWDSAENRELNELQDRFFAIQENSLELCNFIDVTLASLSCCVEGPVIDQYADDLSALRSAAHEVARLSAKGPELMDIIMQTNRAESPNVPPSNTVFPSNDPNEASPFSPIE